MRDVPLYLGADPVSTADTVAGIGIGLLVGLAILAILVAWTWSVVSSLRRGTFRSDAKQWLKEAGLAVGFIALIMLVLALVIFLLGCIGYTIARLGGWT